MATISDGSTTISPPAKLSAAESIESRNIVHELLGGGVAVTFGPEALRTSTLAMYFADEASCEAAYLFFKNGYVFELTDTDKPSTNMFFVVAGAIERELQTDTRDGWILSVDVQEVVQ